VLALWAAARAIATTPPVASPPIGRPARSVEPSRAAPPRSPSMPRSPWRSRALTDYAVRSQPILIIVLTQSSGKYNLHCRTFSAECMLSISFVRLAISVAFSEGCTCGTAKIGTRGEASKFIVLLRAVATMQFLQESRHVVCSVSHRCKKIPASNKHR
jgi:hypothetical protein